jgi:hypothetical protein
MIDIFLSLTIPVLVGFLIFSTIENRLNFSLKLLFSIPLGFGLTSILYYLWLLTGADFIFYKIFELLMLLLTVLVFFNNSKKTLKEQSKFQEIQEGNLCFSEQCIDKKYFFLFAFINVVAVFLFYYFSTHNPLGSWDGWRVWNTKAEFLYKGGEYWKNVFLLPSPLSHSDYPLFLPSTIARIWKNLGTDSIYTPISIAFLFTFSLFILVLEFLKTIKNHNIALLCASSLIGSQLFIISGAGQFADIPLSLFILSSICLVFLSEKIKSEKLVYLAGLFCGMSAWVKNEGFLFVFALSAAVLYVFLKSKQFIKIKYFFEGIVPILIFLLIFKFNLPAVNDIIQGMGYTDTFAKIFDISRYLKVAMAFINFLIGNASFYILAVFLAMSGFRIPEDKRFSTMIAIICLSIMASGYLFIYVLTPHNIDWHLRTSFDRVFLQIWPSIIVTAYICSNKTKI